MKNLTIQRYSPASESDWNKFVGEARNSTFLFDRGFMDYHSDRFADHSLIAEDGTKIIALLPANEIIDADGKRILQSHGGLTYGGWIVGERHPDASEMLRIFDKTAEYCVAHDISALDYRPIPFIYSPMPAQEDLYALFRVGATLMERSISCAINLHANPGFNTQQRRNLKRAMQLECEIREEDTVQEFHRLLSECLAERHDAVPVHTAEELQLLKSRFPKQIRIFMIYEGENPQAGVCIFDCGNVVHAQYICSTPRGRINGLLTRLFAYLADSRIFPEASFFDFGTCNENHGLYLNEGLYRQKHSLGGSGVIYERYKLNFACEE